MNKEFNSKNWIAKKHKTASELEAYFNSIKDKIINHKLTKIMIMGHLFNDALNHYDYINGKWFMYDNDNNYVEIDETEVEFLKPDVVENACLSLDEPVVLFFGENKLEIEYCEGSLAQIGLNTLSLNEISAIEGKNSWKDVSLYFSKNIINQKLVDIEIRKTKEVYFPCFTFEREDGEDMYNEIILIFENGFKLEIAMDCADYMSVCEVKF